MPQSQYNLPVQGLKKSPNSTKGRLSELSLSFNKYNNNPDIFLNMKNAQVTFAFRNSILEIF